MRADLERVSRWPLLPVALLAVVVTLDAALCAGPSGVLVVGVLDEPCHLATAALALLAAPRLTAGPRATGLVLLASVGIDVDHVPLYLGVPGVAADGRPYTHSLLTVLVLLALAATPRARAVCRPLALGVGLHLVRDVATGPGVPLWWPVSGSDVLLPYGAYLALLAAAAAVATSRLARPARVPAVDG